MKFNITTQTQTDEQFNAEIDATLATHLATQAQRELDEEMAGTRPSLLVGAIAFAAIFAPSVMAILNHIATV